MSFGPGWYASGGTIPSAASNGNPALLARIRRWFGPRRCSCCICGQRAQWTSMRGGR